MYVAVVMCGLYNDDKLEELLSSERNETECQLHRFSISVGVPPDINLHQAPSHGVLLHICVLQNTKMLPVYHLRY